MSLQRNGSGFNGSGGGAFVLSKAASLSQSGGAGASPLCAAVLNNADEAKLMSLLAGTDEFGDTALGREIEACEDGNNFSVSLGVLRCLLAKRWSLKSRLWRQALLAGARSGRACLLQVLQDQDPEAWTAALCDNDMDGERQEHVEHVDGSVLHWAAAGGHPALLASLARSIRLAGGDVFSRDADGRTFADVLADRHRRLLPDLCSFEPTPSTAVEDFRCLLELIDPPTTSGIDSSSKAQAEALDCLASAAWQVKRLASRRDGENNRDRAERARQAVRLCAQADNCEQLVAALVSLGCLRPLDIDEDFLRELTQAGWCAAVRPLLPLVQARPIECCFGVVEACHEALQHRFGGADVASGLGDRVVSIFKRFRVWCLSRASSQTISQSSVALTALKRRAERVGCTALDRVWSVAGSDDCETGIAGTDEGADSWQARVHRHFFEGRKPRLRPWRLEFDALSGTRCVREYTERVWRQSNIAESPTSLWQLPKVLLLSGASPRVKLLGQCVSVALLAFLLLLLTMNPTVKISTALYAFTWLCFLCQVGQEAQEFVSLRCFDSQLPAPHLLLTICWILASTATALGLSLRPLETLAQSGRALLGVGVPLWLLGLVYRAAAYKQIGCLILQVAFVIADDLLPAAVTLAPLAAAIAFATTIQFKKEPTDGKVFGLLGNETDSIDAAVGSSAFLVVPAAGNFPLSLAALGLVLLTALLAGRVSVTLKRRSGQVQRCQLRHRLGTALLLRHAPGPLPAPLNLMHAAAFLCRLIVSRRMIQLRNGRQQAGGDSTPRYSNGGDCRRGSGGGGNGAAIGTFSRRSRPSESDARATQCMYQSSHAGVSGEAEDGSLNPLLMASASGSGAAGSCAHRELRRYQLFQAGALRGFRKRLTEVCDEDDD